MAADQGFADAQTNLGTMYGEGRGERGLMARHHRAKPKNNRIDSHPGLGPSCFGIGSSNARSQFAICSTAAVGVPKWPAFTITLRFMEFSGSSLIIFPHLFLVSLEPSTQSTGVFGFTFGALFAMVAGPLGSNQLNRSLAVPVAVLFPPP